MKKGIRVVIVVCFGMLGVHKFLDKDYKMGILYLCTLGLFGVGWIVDIYKELTGNTSKKYSKSLMNSEILKKIDNGELPEIAIGNLILKDGEICHYADRGYTFEDKTVTTGYTGKSSGVSIRIMKGLTYRTGGSGGKAIRETQRTKYNGTLCLTNMRVIFVSTKESFDKPLNKITALIDAKDGVIIQTGSKSYSIIIPTHSEFVKVFNMLKAQNSNKEKLVETKNWV